MPNQMKHSGFSLIELAIVLFILGLLLGTLLQPLSQSIEQDERQETQDQLEEIKEVIYGFAIRNNRLPCPDCRSDTEGTCDAGDSDDGLEDREGANNTCESSVGNLPWTTLGVKETDAWDQHFTYRVTNSFADDADETGCTPVTAGVSFSLCSDGDITILDGDGGNNIATSIPAIIVSHGKNWAGTPSAHEEENYDDSTNAADTLQSFVNRDYGESGAAQFDDLMIWISPHVIRNRMLQAGSLP